MIDIDTFYITHAGSEYDVCAQLVCLIFRVLTGKGLRAASFQFFDKILISCELDYCRLWVHNNLSTLTKKSPKKTTKNQL